MHLTSHLLNDIDRYGVPLLNSTQRYEEDNKFLKKEAAHVFSGVTLNEFASRLMNNMGKRLVELAPFFSSAAPPSNTSFSRLLTPYSQITSAVVADNQDDVPLSISTLPLSEAQIQGLHAHVSVGEEVGFLSSVFCPLINIRINVGSTVHIIGNDDTCIANIDHIVRTSDGVLVFADWFNQVGICEYTRLPIFERSYVEPQPLKLHAVLALAHLIPLDNHFLGNICHFSILKYLNKFIF